MNLDKYTRQMNIIMTVRELKQITYEEFITILKTIEREAFSDDKMSHESLEALRLVMRAVRITEKTMKTQKPIIDADTEQATRHETRVRAQPEIIIAEEIDE